MTHASAEYGEVLKGLGDPVFEVQPDGRVIFANEAALSLVEEAKTLEGKEIGGILQGEWSDHFHRSLKKAIDSGSMAKFNVPAILDGNTVKTENIVFPGPGLIGKKKSAFVVVAVSTEEGIGRTASQNSPDVNLTEDVLLMKQMEFMLSATKTNLDIIDSDFNIRYVDKAWCRFYGEPNGRKCYQYFMDRTEPCEGCGLPEALKTKKPIVTEEVLSKENNRAIQVTTFPFQDESGEWLLAEVNVDISQRKKMEDELKQVNSFLDLIIENIPNMLFLKDAKDLKFVKLNKAGEDLLGYKREDLIGKNDYDFFPKDQADFFVAKDRATIAGGETVDIPEEGINTRKKDSRILHTKKVPIRNEKGEVLFLMGISEDITERKEIETRLKLFRDLINQSGDSLFLVNAETGRFLDVNDQAYIALGYSKEELLSMKVQDIEALISGPEELREEFKKVKKHGHYIFRGEHIRKDGQILPVEINQRYVESENVPYIVAVVRDITERIELERQLKESEKKYRTIFENTGTITAIVDSDMNIVMANSEFESFFGYSPKETGPKKTIDDFIHDIDREKARNYHRLRRIDPQSAPSKYEVKMIDHAGRERETYVTVALVTGTETSVLSFLDLTELKEQESELKRQRDLLDSTNKALEHKVAELSRALGHIKRLEGLVPICSSCKKIMKSGGDPKKKDSWVNIEKYISDRTEASFTHGLCPDCMREFYGDYIDKKKKT